MFTFNLSDFQKFYKLQLLKTLTKNSKGIGNVHWNINCKNRGNNPS